MTPTRRGLAESFLRIISSVTQERACCYKGNNMVCSGISSMWPEQRGGQKRGQSIVAEAYSDDFLGETGEQLQIHKVCEN